MAIFFFFFFFFFFESGVKLDEESIENGLEIQKFLVVCLFWGGCHHPNKVCCKQGRYIYLGAGKHPSPLEKKKKKKKKKLTQTNSPHHYLTVGFYRIKKYC